jgi:membrane-bound ClpP family serine protease
VLLWIEVLLVPGTTVVGVAGLAAMGGAVYLMYTQYGTWAGHYALFATVLVSLVSIIIGFKTGAWEMFSLKDTVEGKFETEHHDSGNKLKAGDTGKALSPLKPVGKAMINGSKVEVQARTGYIDKNEEIEVVKVVTNTIIVKRKT